MKKLIITIIIFIISASVIYCQTNDTTFKTITKPHHQTASLYFKLNRISVLAENSSSIGLYGADIGIQYNLFDKESLVGSINPLFFSRNGKGLEYTGIFISAGPKFYFEDSQSDIRGYLALAPGIVFIPKDYHFFTLSAALGIEYNITKNFGVNLKGKPILLLPYAVLLSINLGIHYTTK